jgi:hypothetical protein
MEEDIQVEIAVGTLVGIMTILKDIETGIDGMSIDLLDVSTIGTTETHPSTVIMDDLNDAIIDQKTLLATDQYPLNEYAILHALEIERPRPDILPHETHAHQVHNQRRYNSRLEQSPPHIQQSLLLS